MPKLLIVYHTQSGNTGQLAARVEAGARTSEGCETVMLKAFDAGVDDLRSADALLIGTPENFGYMSGAIKDFFDRTYYPVEGQMEGVPYAVFVSAGNDGTGAVREIDRIANGYGWRKVAEPVISRKHISDPDLQAAFDLGQAMATGLELGVF